MYYLFRGDFMKTVACIGVGNRGSKYLLELNIFHKKEIKPVAICDVKPEKLVRFGKKYKIAEDMRFQNDDAFFDKGVLADGLIISTPDKEHFRHAKRAIEVGYKTILLEKPVSKYIEETKEIARLADEYGARVVVCLVVPFATNVAVCKVEVAHVFSLFNRNNSAKSTAFHSIFQREIVV